MKYYLITILIIGLSCKSANFATTEIISQDFAHIKLKSKGSSEEKWIRDIVKPPNSNFCLLTYADDGQECGVEVWNLKKMKLVYNLVLPNQNHSIDDPGLVDSNKFIQVNYNDTNLQTGGTTQLIFDLHKMIYHKKFFSTKAWQEVSQSWSTKYKTFENLIFLEEFELNRMKTRK